ncbi:AAA family ATPase [Streptomyces cyaneochromogenes]|uniref:AAA family ATPase n=1 Tax=Streptomyces cyaneochromogenes TaxID=2496836 RepID=A0A3Q9EW52_9ACTN|nr:ATP-binding protein [Streptomyces cyaneochromogenes]AZQ32099.1 AAA family ATPase [Streptomyces cyaneochromogenes]AZQ40124.1 AAA family ATPase [Streptomyces cyaneochromogenes]
MEEEDNTVGAPAGPERDVSADGALGGGPYSNTSASTAGSVIVGDCSVVIDANLTSTVTPLEPQARPHPVRRDRAEPLNRPHRQLQGRAAELAELGEAVRAAQDSGGIVQLVGPAGVGKSTLMRHAARLLAPGPDGALFLSAARREVADLAQEMFEACYEVEDYAPAGRDLRRLMARVRMTVYIDEADLTTEQVAELADMAPQATFVFASRDRLPGDVDVVEVPGLSREMALDLLVAWGLRRPQHQGKLVEAHDLCTPMLGRPLLLLRAAGLARIESSDEPTVPRPTDAEAILQRLFDRLDTEQQNVLRLLATLDAELSPSHVGTLCGISDPIGVCADLTDLGLVQAEERGYRIASDALDEAQRRNRPFPAEQLCDHFSRWATLPTITPTQVVWHGAALERAMQLAQEQGVPHVAVSLARAVSPQLARSLRLGVWIRVVDEGRRAAWQADDERAKAYFTHEKGIQHLLTGRHVTATAHLAEAAELWQQLGDTDAADATRESMTAIRSPSGTAAGVSVLPGAADAAGAGAATAASAGIGCAPWMLIAILSALFSTTLVYTTHNDEPRKGAQQTYVEEIGEARQRLFSGQLIYTDPHSMGLVAGAQPRRFQVAIRGAWRQAKPGEEQAPVKAGAQIGVKLHCSGNVRCTPLSSERQNVLSRSDKATWTWALSARDAGKASVALTVTAYLGDGNTVLVEKPPQMLSLDVAAAPSDNSWYSWITDLWRWMSNAITTLGGIAVSLSAIAAAVVMLVRRRLPPADVADNGTPQPPRGIRRRLRVPPVRQTRPRPVHPRRQHTEVRTSQPNQRAAAHREPRE